MLQRENYIGAESNSAESANISFSTHLPSVISAETILEKPLQETEADNGTHSAHCDRHAGS